MLFSKILNKLSSHSSLFSNAAWLLSAELTAKVSRILTIIAMAHFLLPASFGIAMLALAIHDVIRLLMRCGSGAQIIQCTDQELPSFAGNGQAVQWIVCLGLFSLQNLIAIAVGWFYQNEELTALLQIMALVYLGYPLVSIRAFLLQRANQMRLFSLCNGACIIIENLSIALLLFAGAHIYAVAIAKLLFATSWILIFSRIPASPYCTLWQWGVITKMLKTSGRLMSTELLRAARLHTDLFIAGKLLIPEWFGIYSFAKSAGIGLSQSLSNAFTSALFPYLCQEQRKRSEKRKNHLAMYLATLVGCLFLVQGFAAPLYVPLLFDDRWLDAIPLVTLLCCSALPLLWLDTYCCELRARADYTLEGYIRFYTLTLLILLLLIFQPNTHQEFAYLVALNSVVWIFGLLLLTLTKRLLNQIDFVIPKEEKS